MISKQKLLQWIEVKQHVYGPPYDDNSPMETSEYIGKLELLNLLERAIHLGEFVVDNGEEVKG